MKVLIATPIYPPEVGGPATYTKELVARIGDSTDITVVAYAKPGASLEKGRLCTVSTHLPLPIRLVKFFLSIFKEAKQADVLYVQNAVAAGLPTVLAGILRRKPVVLKFVGDEAWERASQQNKTKKLLEEFLEHPDGGIKIALMRVLQGWVLRRCAIVTTPSVYLGEVITKAYRLQSDRVVTNYNAAEQGAQTKAQYVQKKHQIVATARLVAWKGIDGLIEAVALLLPTYPDIHAIIHGDGPSREILEKLAHERGVGNRVIFTGNVSREETWRTRQESEVYVLNSTYEGLPHTALTSFAARIPIVATDIPGTNEAVYHEQSGLLVQPNNPKELSDAIARLFENESLQEKLVAGGANILQEKFSWESHIKTLRGLFNSVLSKPRN